MATYLSTVPAGTEVELIVVPDGPTRARLFQLGFMDGPVECRRRVRNGPVVIHRNDTKLAIGASLADRIEVRRLVV